jgi:2-dehydro-3-deoxyphosphooctonate aldolase (KDO 8-P synthase)
VQQPGGQGTTSGGQREFIPALMRAAVAVGVDALFLEVHPTPERALSDSATMLPLADLRALLETAVAIDRVVKGPTPAQAPDTQ